MDCFYMIMNERYETSFDERKGGSHLSRGKDLNWWGYKHRQYEG